MIKKIILLIKKKLLKIIPKRLLGKKYSLLTNSGEFNICGENFIFDKTLQTIQNKKLCIGHNVIIKKGVKIDARGGLFIGDNVVINKNIIISSTNILKNQINYQPIIIESDVVINNNIFGNSIIKNNHKTKQGLLSHSGNIVFIVSTGRSGSKAIANIINQGSNSECYHDAIPHFTTWACDKLYNNNSDMFLEKIKSIYNASNISNKYIHGQSDQKLSAFIPELIKLFPNAKFIWLIREASSFVNTAYPRGWFANREFNYPENKNEFYNAQVKPSLYDAKHRINGYKTGSFSEDKWKSMTAFERNCWYWSFWNNMIETELNKLNKNQWIQIKLNNLTKDTEKIATFIGMKDFKVVSKKVNIASYKKLTKDDWNEEMKIIFNNYCSNNLNK